MSLASVHSSPHFDVQCKPPGWNLLCLALICSVSTSWSNSYCFALFPTLGLKVFTIVLSEFNQTLQHCTALWCWDRTNESHWNVLVHHFSGGRGCGACVCRGWGGFRMRTGWGTFYGKCQAPQVLETPGLTNSMRSYQNLSHQILLVASWSETRCRISHGAAHLVRNCMAPSVYICAQYLIRIFVKSD